MRLRTTLFALLVVLSIVLSGVVYAGFALHKQDIMAQERASLAQSANSSANDIDQLIHERKETIQFGASAPSVEAHGTRQQQAVLDHFVEQTAFNGVSVMDENGTMRAASISNLGTAETQELLGRDFSDRTYFRRARNDSVYVSELVEADSGNLILTISAPVRENGTVVGTFNGALHVRQGGLFGHSHASENETRLHSVRGAGYTVYPVDDTPTPDESAMVLERATANTTGWTVTVGTPRAALEDRLWMVTVIQTGAVSLAILSIALVGVWLSRTTLRHLQELIDGLTDLEAGVYDRELDLGVTDEWAQISSQFNALATTLGHRESQLRVLNRVLRHNLRNDMSVIIAHADSLLHADLDDETDAKVRKIRQTAHNLIETSEHARSIYGEVISGGDRDPSPVEITALIDRKAEDLRTEYPESTVRTRTPDKAWTVDGEAVPIILDELCRNAFVHNDRPEPGREVTLEVETDGSQTRLVVRDNGPGMPEFERELLTGDREETAIEHGSGLGLWVVNWLVDHLGGTISVSVGEDRGTTVAVRLPVPDETQTDSAGEDPEVTDDSRGPPGESGQ